MRQDMAITMKMVSATPTGEGASPVPAGMKIELDLEVSRTLISIEERDAQRAANKEKGEELRKKAEAEEDAEFEADEDEAEEDVTPKNPVKTEKQNKDG